MKTVQILEPNDCVAPDDWCRPLRLESMSGGHSDGYSFESMYSGTPKNNVKWVRIKDVFGECWFGKQAKELMEDNGKKYVFKKDLLCSVTPSSSRQG